MVSGERCTAGLGTKEQRHKGTKKTEMDFTDLARESPAKKLVIREESSGYECLVESHAACP